MAMAAPASRTPSAATTETRRTWPMSAGGGRPGGDRLEHRRRQRLAPLGELLAVPGPAPGGLVGTHRDTLVVEACLAEAEQLLVFDHPVYSPRDLGDSDDVAC